MQAELDCAAISRFDPLEPHLWKTVRLETDSSESPRHGGQAAATGTAKAQFRTRIAPVTLGPWQVCVANFAAVAVCYVQCRQQLMCRRGISKEHPE